MGGLEKERGGRPSGVVRRLLAVLAHAVVMQTALFNSIQWFKQMIFFEIFETRSDRGHDDGCVKHNVVETRQGAEPRKAGARSGRAIVGAHAQGSNDRDGKRRARAQNSASEVAGRATATGL